MVILCFLGEVSEWLKEQSWNGCVRLVCTKGSNPFFSVLCADLNKYRGNRVWWILMKIAFPKVSATL